ncbi:MAG: hypothetical protein EOO65_01720 [Methanosarcinales archaeon]|nr:MAG: hypothetical protein EOO65_01720 [Methanosarcinales archaeon]
MIFRIPYRRSCAARASSRRVLPFAAVSLVFTAVQLAESMFLETPLPSCHFMSSQQHAPTSILACPAVMLDDDLGESNATQLQTCIRSSAYVNHGLSPLAGSRRAATLDTTFGYLLCRARGGLNDALRVLLSCIQTGITSGRTILLQLHTYRAADLSHFFDFQQALVNIHVDNITLIVNSLLERGINVQPETYAEELFHPNERFALQGAPVETSLDYLTQPHVLFVQDTWSDSVPAVEVFRLIRLQPKVLHAYRVRRAHLPQRYSALHVRNTDYTTDMGILIPQLHSLLAADTLPFYFATDNAKTRALLCEMFPGRLIPSKSTLFSENSEPGKSLHHGWGWQYDTVLLDALVDLLIMARSAAFYPSTNTGYGRLVQALRARPDILDELVGCV